MTIPSRYFHNRTILLFLIINAILVVTGSLLILFRLDSSTNINYIIECRDVGLSRCRDYAVGSALDMAGFVFFLLINFVLSVLISLRTFMYRRQIAVMVLAVCSLISLLAIIVSNALMELR